MMKVQQPMGPKRIPLPFCDIDRRPEARRLVNRRGLRRRSGSNLASEAMHQIRCGRLLVEVGIAMRNAIKLHI